MYRVGLKYDITTLFTVSGNFRAEILAILTSNVLKCQNWTLIDLLFSSYQFLQLLRIMSHFILLENYFIQFITTKEVVR